MPELAPESVEVVELARGRVFVVLRDAGEGVVVLDERGRLVRGVERLAAVARHARALEQVATALAEARLDRRLEHATHSRASLEELMPDGEPRVAGDLRRVLDELETYRRRLLELRDERHRRAQATERTLRRTVSLLTEAARADRAVVRATRRLAVSCTESTAKNPCATALHRWALARLTGDDLPFFHPELDEVDGALFVEEFVRAARA